MITTRKECLKFTDDGQNVIPEHIVIEVPILLEMLQECYMFNAMDAPTETKRMLMEALGEKIDEIILNEQPEHSRNTNWLKAKLNQVEVKIKPYEAIN